MIGYLKGQLLTLPAPIKVMPRYESLDHLSIMNNQRSEPEKATDLSGVFSYLTEEWGTSDSPKYSPKFKSSLKPIDPFVYGNSSSSSSSSSSLEDETAADISITISDGDAFQIEDISHGRFIYIFALIFGSFWLSPPILERNLNVDIKSRDKCLKIESLIH